MREVFFYSNNQGTLLWCSDISNLTERASQEEIWGNCIKGRANRSKDVSWKQAVLIWETARGQCDYSSVCKGGNGKKWLQSDSWEARSPRLEQAIVKVWLILNEISNHYKVLSGGMTKSDLHFK